MRVRVRVPGSTSNLGPGFDCLGLALELPLEVEVETRPEGLEIGLSGPESKGIARDSENLIHASLQRVLRRSGRTEFGLHLRIDNSIPVSRGLGSSGAATVAGVLAGHLLADDGSPDPEQIAHEAAEIEGHPDNVAPSVYGGLVATTCVGAHLHTVQLPFPALDIVLVIPQHAVSTREARRILPEQVPLTAAVFNLSRLAALLGALSTQDLDALRLGMQDRLHQEHRLALVPGLDTALQALLEEPDSLGAAISGSGPTLLALYRSAPDDAGRAAVAALEEAGVTARIQRIRPSTRGASWERVQSP